MLERPLRTPRRRELRPFIESLSAHGTVLHLSAEAGMSMEYVGCGDGAW